MSAKLSVLLHGMVEYQTLHRRDVGIPPYEMSFFEKG